MDRKPVLALLSPKIPLPLTSLWIIAILLHYGACLWVILHHNYLLNDSIIYLTIAQNWKHYATISQSFYEPILPDFQRSPLYPIFLSFLPVPAVLFLQHTLIILCGLLIQKISTSLCPKNALYRYLGVLFCLTPYSIHLPSLVMSETLFLLWLTLFGIFFILFLKEPKWNYLLGMGIFLILGSYTRAAMFPFSFAMVLAVGWLSRSFLKALTLALLLTVGYCPWIYRNYLHTGQFFFTSYSEINLLYGRVGGVLLASEKEMNDDAYLKAYADAYLHPRYSLPTHKVYFKNHINEETERIQAPLLWLHLQQHLEMPWSTLLFYLRTTLQQLVGIGYGTSQHLYQIPIASYSFALLQGFIQVMLYLYFLSLPKNKFWYFWLFSALLWFFIHTAAWADGRYRYITDVWLLFGIIANRAST